MIERDKPVYSYYLWRHKLHNLLYPKINSSKFDKKKVKKKNVVRNTCSPALANEMPSIRCEQSTCESLSRLRTSASVLIINCTGV